MEKGAGREEVRKKGKGCQWEGDEKGEREWIGSLIVNNEESGLGRHDRKVLARS